jgi:hypothetical protein
MASVTDSKRKIQNAFYIISLGTGTYTLTQQYHDPRPDGSTDRFKDEITKKMSR